MNSAGQEDKLKILLVDDHAVVREGYKRLLEKRGDITVAGEADSAEKALTLFAQLLPDVVVMDIALPGVSGIEALRRMRQRRPESKILMFSMYEEAVYADRSMQAGASGYVTKASAPNVLVEAVHAVAEGRKYFSPDIAQELALRHVARDGSASELSHREFEIMRLLVDGLKVKDIAERLKLNVKTVANHQSIIRQKLGAETGVQLARLGQELLQDPRYVARYRE